MLNNNYDKDHPLVIDEEKREIVQQSVLRFSRALNKIQTKILAKKEDSVDDTSSNRTRNSSVRKNLISVAKHQKAQVMKNLNSTEAVSHAII